jgi:hypothetical protein
MADKIELKLEDYTKLLSETTRRFASARTYEMIQQDNYLRDLLYLGYTSPTRWQRLRAKPGQYWTRLCDAWKCLRGTHWASDE